MEPLSLLGAGATIVVATLGFLGIRYTAREGSKSAERTQDTDESRAALDAWRELLEPYRQEVAALRDEVAALRADQAVNRTWRHVALDYMRKLYKHVQTLGSEPPAPPPELEWEITKRKGVES